MKMTERERLQLARGASQPLATIAKKKMQVAERAHGREHDFAVCKIRGAAHAAAGYNGRITPTDGPA